MFLGIFTLPCSQPTAYLQHPLRKPSLTKCLLLSSILGTLIYFQFNKVVDLSYYAQSCIDAVKAPQSLVDWNKRRYLLI